MNFEEIKEKERKTKLSIYKRIESCTIIPAKIIFTDGSSLEYSDGQWVIYTSKYKSSAMKTLNWIESMETDTITTMQEMIKHHL